MGIAKIARTALYEQAWATPMIRLAATYGITGTGLAKVCRNADIPVPPRGYWNKLQHGKAVIRRSPLPPARGDETIVIRASAPAGPPDSRVAARAEAELSPENRIRVLDELRNPHPLVKEATAALKTAHKNRDDARPRPGGTAGPVLDIRVSPVVRSRALRLMDALLKALEARGYAISARGVTIEGETVPLGILEKQDQVLHVATAAELARKKQYAWEHIPKWDYVPNGRLAIFSDAYVWWRRDLRKRWSDGRSGQLEDRLNDVVVDLVALGVALRERAEEQRREAEARAEQERLRQERLRQARMEKARRENLAVCAADLVKARQIRELAVETRKRTAGENAGAVAAWIAWALQIADELDPLGGGVGVLLDRHQKAAEDALATSHGSSYGF